jgi:hypothetical protein
VADVEIAVFLGQDNGPEQRELLRLIRALVDQTSVAPPKRRRPGCEVRMGSPMAPR